LKEVLWEILKWEQDRVMVVDLGPCGARGDGCVEFWGEPRVEPLARGAVVVWEIAREDRRWSNVVFLHPEPERRLR
jgi:hypothetical protein